MNPFSDTFEIDDNTYIPCIIISCSLDKKFDSNYINPKYPTAIQHNSRFGQIRDYFYTELLYQLTILPIARPIAYHIQHMADHLLSVIHVEEKWLPILYRICSYIYINYYHTITNLDQRYLNPLFSYELTLSFCNTELHKSKKWLDYSIMFVYEKCCSSFSIECPYAICDRLLKALHLSKNISFAFNLIDLFCENSESLSLAPYTMAYLSTIVLLNEFQIYEDNEIKPEQEIPEHEFFLYLSLLSTMVPELKSTCLSVSKLYSQFTCINNDNSSKQEKNEFLYIAIAAS